MVVSGQPHAPAGLRPRENFPVDPKNGLDVLKKRKPSDTCRYLDHYAICIFTTQAVLSNSHKRLEGGNVTTGAATTTTTTTE